MAFLSPTFSTDIFISYAHANNRDGWVTRFEKDLQDELDGLINGVEIWRDRELNSNTLFDDRIKANVEGAAIFLALTSPRYTTSEYCRQELDWFFQKAENELLGLSDEEDRYRIFNLLIYRVPHDEWPKEFGRQTGFKLHDDEEGFRLEQDEKFYKKQIRRLALEISEMLESYKEKLMTMAQSGAPAIDQAKGKVSAEPVTAQDANFFRIYLATSSGLLEEEQERLLNELQPSELGLENFTRPIKVVTQIPPPFEAAQHDQRVLAEMQQAELAIHLLNDDPGQKIEDAPGARYIQRQVELGLERAKHQLIWVSPQVDLDAVKNAGHREFLNQLEARERRETSKVDRSDFSDFRRQVGETIRNLQREQAVQVPREQQAILLNYHQKDRSKAWELSEWLEKMGLLAIPQLEFGDPEEHINDLAKKIQKVNRLIFLYGQVDRTWVIDRFWEMWKIADIHKTWPKVCGIYFVPPHKRASEESFSFPPRINNTEICQFDSDDCSNPQVIKPLLGIA